MERYSSIKLTPHTVQHSVKKKSKKIKTLLSSGTYITQLASKALSREQFKNDFYSTRKFDKEANTTAAKITKTTSLTNSKPILSVQTTNRKRTKK